MTRTILLILGILLSSFTLRSQGRILLYYNSNWEITQKNNASYYREAEYNLSNLKLNRKVSDFISSGTKIMDGNFINGMKDGDFTFYYHNGAICINGKYSNNKRIGEWKFYYKDGKIKQTVIFPEKGGRFDFNLVECFDRNGNQTIKNGTGVWANDSISIRMPGYSGLIKIVGQFKDSLRDGEWKSFRASDEKIILTERFKKGQFVKSDIYNSKMRNWESIYTETFDSFPDENTTEFTNPESFLLDQKAYPELTVNSDIMTILKTVTGKEFKVYNRYPVYAYGEARLLHQITANLRYPLDALGKHASGTVYVSITIDSLGKVKETKVKKGVQKDLDKEAIQVANTLTDWLPAIKNGEAIESVVNIPIRFEIK